MCLQKILTRHSFRGVALFLSIIHILTVSDVSAVATFSPPLDEGEVESISIPAVYGSVRDRYMMSDLRFGDPFIVHIQDAHCNPEAQKNIARIIQYFVEQHDFTLIGVEGASGELETDILRSVKDRGLKRRIAQRFLDEAKITGAEFAQITAGSEVEVVGIEDEPLYRSNFDYFIKAVDSYGAYDQAHQAFAAFVDQLSERYCNKAVLELNRWWEKFEEGKLGLGKYVEFICGAAEKTGIPLEIFRNLTAYVAFEVAQAKIDFLVIEKERRSFITSLEKTMKEDALAELVRVSLRFRLGRLSEEDYYGYIERAGRSVGLDNKRFPQLREYFACLKEMRRIDENRLFIELMQLTEMVRDALAVTIGEWEISRIMGDLRLLVRFLKLEVSPEEVKRLVLREGSYSAERFEQFLKRWVEISGIPIPEDLRTVSRMLAGSETSRGFYLDAMKRDGVLTDRFLAEMEKRGVKRAILVSGGFHAKGIIERLKNEGVAYLSVMPSISGVVAQELYLKVMRDRGRRILSESGKLAGVRGTKGERRRTKDEGRGKRVEGGGTSRYWKRAAGNEKSGLAPWSSFMDAGFQEEMLTAILSERLRPLFEADGEVAAGDIEKALADVRSELRTYLVKQQDPDSDAKLARFDHISEGMLAGRLETALATEKRKGFLGSWLWRGIQRIGRVMRKVWIKTVMMVTGLLMSGSILLSSSQANAQQVPGLQLPYPDPRPGVGSRFHLLLDDDLLQLVLWRDLWGLNFETSAGIIWGRPGIVMADSPYVTFELGDEGSLFRDPSFRYEWRIRMALMDLEHKSPFDPMTWTPPSRIWLIGDTLHGGRESTFYQSPTDGIFYENHSDYLALGNRSQFFGSLYGDFNLAKAFRLTDGLFLSTGAMFRWGGSIPLILDAHPSVTFGQRLRWNFTTNEELTLMMFENFLIGGGPEASHHVMSPLAFPLISVPVGLRISTDRWTEGVALEGWYIYRNDRDIFRLVTEWEMLTNLSLLASYEHHFNPRNPTVVPQDLLQAGVQWSPSPWMETGAGYGVTMISGDSPIHTVGLTFSFGLESAPGRVSVGYSLDDPYRPSSNYADYRVTPSPLPVDLVSLIDRATSFDDLVRRVHDAYGSNVPSELDIAVMASYMAWKMEQYNYDESGSLFFDVDDDAATMGLQRSLVDGEHRNLFVCGGIHSYASRFLNDVARSFGMDIRAVPVRVDPVNEDITTHFIAVVKGENQFYFVDYGSILATGTLNLEHALQMMQTAYQSIMFEHTIHNEDGSVSYIVSSPEGRTFRRVGVPHHGRPVHSVLNDFMGRAEREAGRRRAGPGVEKEDDRKEESPVSAVTPNSVENKLLIESEDRSLTFNSGTKEIYITVDGKATRITKQNWLEYWDFLVKILRDGRVETELEKDQWKDFRKEWRGLFEAAERSSHLLKTDQGHISYENVRFYEGGVRITAEGPVLESAFGSFRDTVMDRLLREMLNRLTPKALEELLTGLEGRLIRIDSGTGRETLRDGARTFQNDDGELIVGVNHRLWQVLSEWDRYFPGKFAELPAMLLFLILLDEREHDGKAVNPLEEFADQLAGSMNQIYGARILDELFPGVTLVDRSANLLNEWLFMMKENHPEVLEELAFDEFLYRFVLEEGRENAVLKPAPSPIDIMEDILKRYPSIGEMGEEIRQLIAGIEEIVKRHGTEVIVDVSGAGTIAFVKAGEVEERAPLASFIGAATGLVVKGLQENEVSTLALQDAGSDKDRFMGLLRGFLGGRPGEGQDVLGEYGDLSGLSLAVARMPGGEMVIGPGRKEADREKAMALASQMWRLEDGMNRFLADSGSWKKSRGFIRIAPACLNVHGADGKGFLEEVLKQLKGYSRDNSLVVELMEDPELLSLDLPFRDEIVAVFDEFQLRKREWEEDGVEQVDENTVNLWTRADFAAREEETHAEPGVHLVVEKDAHGVSVVSRVIPIARAILASGGVKNLSPELEEAILALYRELKGVAELPPIEKVLEDPYQFLLPPVSRSQSRMVEDYLKSYRAISTAA